MSESTGGATPGDYRRAGTWLAARNSEARELPMAGIRCHVLQRLRELIAFDATMWASAGDAPRVMHEVCLLYQPPEMLESYLHRQEEDFFRTAVCANPGHTVNLADLVNAERLAEYPIYRDHGRRFGLRHLLGTAETDPLTSVIHTIVLSRSEDRPPFSERDRQLKEFLVPHLFLMVRNNCLMHVCRSGRPDPAVPIHCAAASATGVIHYLEAGFLDLLTEEWPTWHGMRLPAVLSLPARDKETRYTGRRIHLRIAGGNP